MTFGFSFRKPFEAGLALAQAVTSNLASPAFTSFKAPVASERQDKPQRTLLLIQIQIENLSFHQSKACPWFRTLELGFSALTCQGRGSRISWRSLDGGRGGEGQFKPRSVLPLPKQSVGRRTPGGWDVVEDRKYFNTGLKEQKKGKKSKSDMSVSPPCASPLERVQSTRARFVRAKPDPVLRFLPKPYFGFLISVTEVILMLFSFCSTERVLAALLATETKYLPEVSRKYLANFC